jgi:hypothetical protein
MNQMKDLDLLLLLRRIELALCKVHLLLWWWACLLLIGGLTPLAFATGLALARPDLHVVVITGDDHRHGDVQRTRVSRRSTATGTAQR